MEDQLKYFENNPPACLDNYLIKATDNENLVFDGHGEETNPIFNIACKCGSEEYIVHGYNWINPDTKKTYFIGPLELECTKCNSIKEFFDIEKHGYDSQFGHGCYSASGEGKESSYQCNNCNGTIFKLIARFEYTSDLFDDDFPEARGREKELFTWFSLHGRCSACSSLIEICDYECS